MRLFQVLLPSIDNAGTSCAYALESCKRHFIAHAGGCTSFQPASGHWAAPMGNLLSEPMLLHWIVCQPHEWHDTIMPFVVRAFPDQMAFMTIEPDGFVNMVQGLAAAQVAAAA